MQLKLAKVFILKLVLFHMEITNNRVISHEKKSVFWCFQRDISLDENKKKTKNRESEFNL